MKFSDFLVRDAIITDLRATTKVDAIREIVRSVQDAGELAGVDTESLTATFLEREALGSTAIGLGVAFPHGGHPAVVRAFGTIALSRAGVQFNALDGQPVDIFVLLFHTPDQFHGQPLKPGDIYDAIKSLKPYVEDIRFLDRLRGCRTRDEVFDLIVECDRDSA
jgi:mannitol/fructose-specific phosphotransferase system IIA component (Ntr-type)